jgi:ribose transport system permease protein
MEKSININEAAKSPSRINLRKLGVLAPYFGLVLVTVLFGLLTDGKILTVSNLKAMTNDVVITGLVTIGAVFIFGAGYFDMSLGSCVCFAAVMGGYTAIATGNLFLAFIVILAISVALAVMKGLIAAYIKVPYFIFTIVLASVISSAVLVIMGAESSIFLKNAVTEIPAFNFTQMSVINMAAIIGFYLLALVLFNYTPMGVKIKTMGGNAKAARQSGINTKKTTMWLFVICSLGVALAAFLILIRTRTVGNTTATSIGNDVMVALVIGGMPLSGGPRTKISPGILGAVTITILNSGLTIMGLSTGTIQITRGIVFIVVVLVSSLSYRTKLLPR